MTTKCACGGRFRRTDIVESGSIKLNSGTVVPTYKDTDPLVAHWKCTGCGMTREQRKRQPSERESQSSKHCDAGYMNDTRFGDGSDY